MPGSIGAEAYGWKALVYRYGGVTLSRGWLGQKKGKLLSRESTTTKQRIVSDALLTIESVTADNTRIQLDKEN